MKASFQTVTEQIQSLEADGVIADHHTAEILHRIGEYVIVDRYGAFFLTPLASKKTGRRIFEPYTTFQDIYHLYLFDRALRQLMFEFFASAEASLKSVSCYQFCRMSRTRHDAYLDESYYNPLESSVHVERLIEDFRAILGHHSRKNQPAKDYIRQYRSAHGDVPLRVIMPALTLGQTFKFYCFQNESVRNSIAREFAELYRQSYGSHLRLSPRRLRLAFDHIKDFRNICAHGEQLYCARISPSRDVTISRAFSDLKLVLSKHDFSRLQDHFADLLYQAASQFDRPHFAKLLISMGFHRYDPRRKA